MELAFCLAPLNRHYDGYIRRLYRGITRHMHNQDFNLLVKRLFALLKVTFDPDQDIQQGYTLRIGDDLHIDLIGLQPGFINMRAVLGPLPTNANANSDVLLRLLHANNFAFEHPPVSIGIDPDTNGLVVWSRQASSELQHDARCAWFDRFVELASTVHTWLYSADHSSSRSTSASIKSTRKDLRVQSTLSAQQNGNAR